jgi:hypothetical protein
MLVLGVGRGGWCRWWLRGRGRLIMKGKAVVGGVCRGGIGEGIIGGLVTHIRVKGGREDEGRATRQGRGE